MPNILLYADANSNVQVTLPYTNVNKWICFPKMNIQQGWQCQTTSNSGELQIHCKNYYQLFYDSQHAKNFDLVANHNLYCVAGKFAMHFLEQCSIGLNAKERTGNYQFVNNLIDFITFWLPQMEHCPHMLVQVFDSASWPFGAPSILAAQNNNLPCYMRMIIIQQVKAAPTHALVYIPMQTAIIKMEEPNRQVSHAVQWGKKNIHFISHFT